MDKERNSKTNFEIITGEDGIDALKLVIDVKIGKKIKALFIDENMEYLNGSESVSIIRRLQKFDKISKFFIASVTSFEDDDTKNTLKRSGMDDVFSKPMSKNQLIDFFDKYKILI